MKQIYMKPELELVQLTQKAQLLSGSIAVGNAYNNEAVLSRRSHGWDEEEDDEEESY